MTAPITPVPIPAGALAREPTIVLAGGTFDPPHLAHVRLAALARDRAAGPDAWLLFVPAARSPFKPGEPGASDAHRAEMLRLGAAGVARAGVWTDELDRAGSGAASYWIDTLRRASRAAPGCPLRFVLGADQAAAFHRWRDHRGILDLADPIVLLRAPISTRADLRDALAQTGAWDDGECRWWDERAVEAPLMDVSATEIRERVSRGDADRAWLEARVGPEVTGYILSRGLYQASP